MSDTTEPIQALTEQINDLAEKPNMFDLMVVRIREMVEAFRDLEEQT